MKNVFVTAARWLVFIILALIFGLPIIVIWVTGFILGIAYGIFIKGFNGKVWLPGS